MRALILAVVAISFIACSAPQKPAPDYDRAVRGHDKALERLDRE